MPDLMTKQDAIEYLLYMKHDVKAKSLMDIALDTAIEELKQPTIEPEVRHGRWINDTFCSECKRFPVPADVSVGISNKELTKYFSRCPHCGARMDSSDTNVSCI